MGGTDHFGNAIGGFEDRWGKISVSTYSRGSEWRKWDLHVHAPGTRLNNGYSGSDPVKRFLEIVEQSGVAVVGIADYYSAESFFVCRERQSELFPASQVVLVPNIELRLTDVVNSADEYVHAHILLRPDVGKKKVSELLSAMESELSEDSRKLSVADLESADQLESATVSRESVAVALKKSFGETFDDHAMVVVAANNDGIRPARGNRRRAQTADNVDEFAHGFFGSAKNTDYFLDPDRAEGKKQLAPKPVFAGSDAHNFEELETWLGQEVRTKSTHKSVTWIKADPTFDGLLQTRAEPGERVRIQAVRPDYKQSMHVLDSVRFSGSEDFPDEIQLNPNLVAIVGPRSSGKSALLAYIAHAVDSEYAIGQQLESDPSLRKAKELAGPAASKSWDDVSHIRCEPVWADPDAEGGKIIYVPQNSLFKIGDRPDEITRRIQPALFREHRDVDTAYRKYETIVKRANVEIRIAVDDWFAAADEVIDAVDALKTLGDEKSVIREQQRLDDRIAKLETASTLTKTESNKYRTLSDKLNALESRRAEVQKDLDNLRSHSFGESDTPIQVRITSIPPSGALPADLEAKWVSQLRETELALQAALTLSANEFEKSRKDELALALKQKKKLEKQSEQLIAKATKHDELVEMSELRNEIALQVETIGRVRARFVEATERKEEAALRIHNAVASRAHALERLKDAFVKKDRPLDGIISVDFEAQISAEDADPLCERFNRRAKGPYLVDGKIDLDSSRNSPGDFLEAVYTEEQKIRKDESKIDVATATLTLTESVRFSATLDQDRIGGFEPSSMTPGKQALFALTMILRESDEPWPLLIDQPEDDLDSRSISSVLVSFLLELKKARQIIMVSHNANLVVGADAEQVIVANRHGDDRRNRSNRVFDYYSGSLENSKPFNPKSKFTLESCGIREHACELLDGGKDAFEKRRLKYKIRANQ